MRLMTVVILTAALWGCGAPAAPEAEVSPGLSPEPSLSLHRVPAPASASDLLRPHPLRPDLLHEVGGQEVVGEEDHSAVLDGMS